MVRPPTAAAPAFEKIRRQVVPHNIMPYRYTREAIRKAYPQATETELQAKIVHVDVDQFRRFVHRATLCVEHDFEHEHHGSPAEPDLALGPELRPRSFAADMFLADSMKNVSSEEYRTREATFQSLVASLTADEAHDARPSQTVSPCLCGSFRS